MPEGSDLLRIEDLNVSFDVMGGTLDAVRGASLRVLPGKVTALVGESGSGKSVIGQSVMGILPRIAQARGRILFDDPAAADGPVDVLGLRRDGPAMRRLRGGRIGKIFQEPMTSLSPLHTIGNQISEALRIHERAGKAEARTRSEEMLGLVGFPDPGRAFDMYPFELSGGMRQRAMIAMALICRPALLIADEPTTALDVTIQAQILGLLRKLQAELGMAMLLITHDLGVVANVADEVVVIYHGRIMEAGPVEAIFRRPGHPYLKGLMAAAPHFDMKPGERLKSLRDIPVTAGRLLGLQSASSGPGVSPAATPTAPATAAEPAPRPRPEVLVSVRHITKSYTSHRSRGFLGSEKKQVRAVDDVSFDIRRGECLGLVGESGSGKTTVSKILMRAVTPDAGSVIYEAAEGPVDLLATGGEALRGFRPRMQMVFQDPVSSLSPRMTVRNILAEPLEIHRRGGARARFASVERLIEAIGLDAGYLNRYPHSMSGGQRQRIGIARALALGPEMLVCDEPVSALDVSVQAQILNLLKDLQKELHLTYLFISHNLAVVDYMADRIAVMCGGRIVEMAPREALMEAPVHPYTKALLAAVPFPDLDRRFDFSRLRAGPAAEGRGWAPAFRAAEGGAEGAGDSGLRPVALGGDHVVLARAGVDAAELRP